MSDISLDVGHMIGVWLATLLFGIYTILFGICIYVLVKSGSRNRILYAAVSSLYGLSAAHIGITLRHALSAFIYVRDHPGGTMGYLANLSNPFSAAKDFLYVISNIIADSLVVWRLYVIWDRNIWICIVPVLTLIAAVVAGGLIIGYELADAMIGQMYYVPKVDMWSYIAFSLTLATNILVTALIAFKLWWMSRQFKLALPDQTQKFYHRVIMVIIESGALYSASVAVLLAVYANRMSGATFLALDVVPQIVGISPTLIIVQLHICNSRLHTDDKDLPISSLQWAPKSNRSTSASPPACSVRKPLPQHSKLPLEHSSLGLRPTSSNPDISTYRDQWISPAHEREKPRQCSET